MGNKIDWVSIKKEYVEGVDKEGKRIYPSVRELAEKYGCAYESIGRKSSKEDWLSQRQILVNKISTRSQQKTIEQISDKGTEFDLACFKDAQKIREKLNEILEAITKDDPYAIKKLNAVGYGISTAQGIGKNALGESKSDQEKVIIEVEKID